MGIYLRVLYIHTFIHKIPAFLYAMTLRPYELKCMPLRYNVREAAHLAYRHGVNVADSLSILLFVPWVWHCMIYIRLKYRRRLGVWSAGLERVINLTWIRRWKAGLRIML